VRNPYAIIIHCDGAMDYDARQTGGNGFIIEFPDSFALEPISESLRNDEQGIHRLEMISILMAMEELLSFGKKNSEVLRRAAGVSIYTDRVSVTDGELLNPWKIQGYRSNRWKTHEGKPVKDKDLLDKIDKTRKKLLKEVGGAVEIKYKRRAKNKIADKLSKAGKKSGTISKRIIAKKNKNVARRKFSGSEIDYSLIQEGETLVVRVYAWEPVQGEFEVSVEIADGKHKGETMKIYVSSTSKMDIHRHHYYEIKIKSVYTHHVHIKSFMKLKLIK
jgi:ribonuclease HI